MENGEEGIRPSPFSFSPFSFLCSPFSLNPGPTMLNYIWAGLIISAFVFALGNDIRDLSRDTYRNGKALPVALAFPQGYDSAARRVPVEIRIDPGQYASFY